jgi:hypothetical protein
MVRAGAPGPQVTWIDVMHRPDFFIAGAPKCGTTALYEYLRGHPQVFLPRIKEPHFFGTDLSSPFYVRDPARYRALFDGAAPGQRVGEASVWYLYSERAAAEIQAQIPDARFIVMLRNPVEMVYSYYSQRLYNHTEDVLDFEAALALEDERRRGRHLPAHMDHVHGLMYSSIARYGAQLERLLQHVDAARVLVLVYDDFRARTDEALARTLRFLGLDEEYHPELRVVNANKRVRSSTLFELLHYPPAPVRALLSAVVPPALRHRVRRSLVGLNRVPDTRPPISPAAAELLRAAYRDDVARLSALLGRDFRTLWGF